MSDKFILLDSYKSEESHLFIRFDVKLKRFLIYLGSDLLWVQPLLKQNKFYTFMYIGLVLYKIGVVNLS